MAKIGHTRKFPDLRYIHNWYDKLWKRCSKDISTKSKIRPIFGYEQYILYVQKSSVLFRSETAIRGGIGRGRGSGNGRGSGSGRGRGSGSGKGRGRGKSVSQGKRM